MKRVPDTLTPAALHTAEETAMRMMIDATAIQQLLGARTMLRVWMTTSSSFCHKSTAVPMPMRTAVEKMATAVDAMIPEALTMRETRRTGNVVNTTKRTPKLLLTETERVRRSVERRRTRKI
jgi:hypothetical protein